MADLAREKREYLVALYLQPGAGTAKRRERAAALLEWPGLNRAVLAKQRPLRSWEHPWDVEP